MGIQGKHIIRLGSKKNIYRKKEFLLTFLPFYYSIIIINISSEAFWIDNVNTVNEFETLLCKQSENTQNAERETNAWKFEDTRSILSSEIQGKYGEEML